MNLTQFYPFFLNFDMILAYFSNNTLKIWYWDFCKRVKGNWKDKDFWKKLSPMVIRKEQWLIGTIVISYDGQ